MSQTTQSDPLVDFLLGLEKRQDRGALAALRTGLGKRPGEAPRMFPYIGPFLRSTDPGRASVIAVFLTASLFAKHPEHASGRSLGLALSNATKSDRNPDGKHGEPGVETRFTAMLDAYPDDIPRHLDGLISLCESAGTGLDWYRFRLDVIGLLGDNEENRDRVRLKWARDFWRGEQGQTATDSTEGTNI
jgi:CRISPR system Cascade subunit CasB